MSKRYSSWRACSCGWSPVSTARFDGQLTAGVKLDGSNTTPSIGFNQSTGNFTVGSSCPTGEVDYTLTQGAKVPAFGFIDGDDHVITASEFTVTNGATCNGTYRGTQAHDSNNNHAATFWWKTCSLRSAAPELLGALPTD